MTERKQKIHKTWVEISRANLLHNLRATQSLLGKKTKIVAIVKADAYGHGLGEVAKILGGEKGIYLGVDSIDEARALKMFGVKQPIIILGYISPTRRLEAMQNNFHISLYSVSVVSNIVSLLKAHPKIKPHLHIKIETGTNRLGIPLRELAKIKLFPPIEGLYTHFADIENTRSVFYKDQLHEFKKALWILKQRGIVLSFIHTAASAALLMHLETRLSLARLGVSLYGLWPSSDVQHLMLNKIKLRPVLQWKTRIAQIKEIQKGETVGYDRTWRAKKKTRIAILPVGYYDGYDRGLSNCGEVLIKGNRAKVIGRICMNMIMIDITGIGAKENDEAVLLGVSGKEKITAEDIAKKIGTINYEIVSRINPLLPRIIK